MPGSAARCASDKACAPSMLPRIALAFVIAAACASCERPPAANTGASAVDAGIPDDAAFALFHAVVPGPASADARTHCLEIDGRDPPASVVSRLRADGYAVAPRSQCIFDANRPEVRDPSGRRASRAFIRGFARRGAGAADAAAGTVAGGLDGAEYAIELRFDGRHWRIVRKQSIAIS